MKRILLLLVAALSLMTARAEEQGYFVFGISGGQAVITGLTSAAQSMNLKSLDVPGFIHYNGMVWPTRIRTSAFQGCKASDIIINYGCQRIDDYAFASCDNLGQVRIPSSVTHLGAGLVLNSGKNQNSILVAMAVQEPLDESSMPSSAFINSLSTNGVTLALSTRAAYNAFTKDSRIQGMGFKAIKLNAAFANDYFDGNGTSYVVTKAATDMADGTMMLVGSINEDVVVRSSMIYLDDYGATDFTHGYRCMTVAKGAFYSEVADYGVDYIVLPCDIKTFTWRNAPDGSKIDNEIFHTPHTNIYTNINETLTTINVDCDTISEGAFDQCKALTSLTLGEGIKSIGSSAFAGCDLLETVTLPASLTLVGYNPFISCVALKAINSRGELGKNCFCYDGVLYQEDPEDPNLNILVSCPMNIDHYPKIYENTTKIRSTAFSNLKLGLKDEHGILDFPNLRSIERYAFSHARLGGLHLPSYCGIEEDAFTYMYGIHEINFGSITPPPSLSERDLNKLKSMRFTINCPQGSVDKYKEVFYSNQSTLYFREGGYDFQKDNVCYLRIRESSIQDHYVKLDYYFKIVRGFYGGDLWQPSSEYPPKPSGEIVIPAYIRPLVPIENIYFSIDSIPVKILGLGCLNGYNDITSIELPTTITAIDHYAMANLPNLERLVVHMTTLPTLGYSVWDGIDQSKVTLVVPPGMKAAYAAADQWKDFGTIIEENVSYDLYVKGIQVTSKNYTDVLGDGTVSYDPVGKRLTLNGVNYNESYNDYFIKNDIDGLEIVVNGVNFIGPNVLSGIRVGDNAKTTISGTGSLTIEVGQTGMHNRGLLTITGGVKLSSKGLYGFTAYNYAGITISGATTRVKGYGSNACLSNVNGLTLNDGLQIVEPAGAHIQGWTMMDADGNILRNTWFLIAQSASVPGDVNGDGVCTSSDVTALYNAILYNDYSKVVNGDQNGDNAVTSSDVTAVYNILMGL